MSGLLDGAFDFYRGDAMRLTQRFWLCGPPMVLCLLDGGLTLAGQSSAFWAGSSCAVEELNPIARVLLVWHPLLFGLSVLGWALSASVAILFLPRRWAVPLAFVLAFGHALGASTWLARHGLFGWLLAGVFLAMANCLVSLSWKWADVGARRPV